MAKNNLKSRLKNSLLTGLLAGCLGLTGCGRDGSVPQPPKQPSISQTVSLVNDVDIDYKATLQNLSQATRKVTHDGTEMYSTIISYSPYNETLINREKGVWGFELKSGNLSDTDSVTVPNYDPVSNFSSLETNLNERYEGSSKTFNLESLLINSDKNPEDRPVPLIDSRSLDGKTSVSIDGYNLTISAIGAPGLYQVGVNFGSDEGGRGSGVIQGNIIEVPDQIAFWRGVKTPGCILDYCEEDIYLMNEDGTDVRRLTNNPAQDLEPAWSPDGLKIAFTTNREDVNGDGIGDISIYVMNADGSNQRRISPDTIGHAQQADWSPDGSKIAFRYIDYNLGLAGIAVMNPDRNGFTRLIEEPFSAQIPGWPSWSPDGTKIAFMTHRDGNWEIYKINTDKTEPERLTNNLSVDQQPRWSSDGSKIAFISDREGGLNIYTKNLENGNIEKITNISVSYDPAWSTDGKKLAFTSERDGWYHLYKQNLNTGEVTRLTFEGANRYPAWRPR